MIAGHTYKKDEKVKADIQEYKRAKAHYEKAKKDF